MTNNEIQALQDSIAALALSVSSDQAFVLAGGKALQAHGLSHRPTEDVDLFTNNHDSENFEIGREKIVQVLREAGYAVDETQVQEGFCRLAVTDPPTGRIVEVELGIDWRSDHDGVPLAVGTALSPRDAVINKALALFGRGYARDYIDFNNIVQSGAYSFDEILQLAPQHDPGFDPRYFADALRAARRLPPSAAEQYDLAAAEWQGIVDRMSLLADYVDKTLADPEPEHMTPLERIQAQQDRMSTAASPVTDEAATREHDDELEL